MKKKIRKHVVTMVTGDQIQKLIAFFSLLTFLIKQTENKENP